jgi:hypothetical protein
MRVAYIVLCFIACSRSPQPSHHDFGLHHRETTGVTNAVITPHGEVSIQFSATSDRRALESLTALRASVFVPNADGISLHVLGELGSDIRTTESGPGFPQAERYADFRLGGWYLIAPFDVADGLGESLDPPKMSKRSELKASDFWPAIDDNTLTSLVRVSAE